VGFICVGSVYIEDSGGSGGGQGADRMVRWWDKAVYSDRGANEHGIFDVDGFRAWIVNISDNGGLVYAVIGVGVNGCRYGCGSDKVKEEGGYGEEFSDNDVGDDGGEYSGYDGVDVSVYRVLDGICGGWYMLCGGGVVGVKVQGESEWWRG